MKNLSFYSEKALLERNIKPPDVGYMGTYKLITEKSVTKLVYTIIHIVATSAIFSSFQIPHFISGTHYFDSSSHAEISSSKYCKRKNIDKNEEEKIREDEEHERHQKYTESYEWLGRLYEEAKNSRRSFNDDIFSEAIEKYQKAEESCNNDLNNRKKIRLAREAYLNHLLNNFDESSNFFNEALNIDSNYTFAKNQKAVMLNEWGDILQSKEGDFEEAIKKYRLAFQSCTDDRTDLKKHALHSQGLCHNFLDNLPESLTLFDEALSLDPNFEEARKDKADVMKEWGDNLYEDENYLEAIQKYREAYELCSEERMVLKRIFKCNEAKCEMAMGNYLKSTEIFDEILETDVNFKPAMNQRSLSLNAIGETFFKEEKYNKASEMFEKAFKDCSVSFKGRKRFFDNLEKSNNAIMTLNLKCQGDHYFSDKKHKHALDKYYQAFELSNILHHKESFRLCMANAQSELDASIAYEIGIMMLKNGRDFNSCILKLKSAHEISNCHEQKEIFRSKLIFAEEMNDKLIKLLSLWDEACKTEKENPEVPEKGAKQFKNLLKISEELVREFPKLKQFEQMHDTITLYV